MEIAQSCMLLFGVLATAAGGPLSLENEKIRIEVEPRTFSVRFIGQPGGYNFLEPLHLSAADQDGVGWIEPGGLFTDVLPLRTENAVLRRGPAEVVEHRDDYLLLLGPEQPDLHWRVKKEFQLERDAAALTYKVTVMGSLKEERDVRIRSTARLAWSGTLTVPAEAGRLSLIRGSYLGFDKIVNEPAEDYVLPLKSSKPRSCAIVSSTSPEISLATDFGIWSRRLTIQSSLAEPDAENRVRLLVLMDDDTHTYEAALEGAQSGVNVGAPLVVIEHWSIGPPVSKVAHHLTPEGFTIDEDGEETLP